MPPCDLWSEDQYREVQDSMYELCPSPLTPLHYETLAWRLSHATKA
jgi:hypothetical protein